MGISPELTREQVLASMGLDEKTFQEIMRPQAVFELQTDLLLDAIVKAKPAAAKGQYIKSVALTSTMGPGVKVAPKGV